MVQRIKAWRILSLTTIMVFFLAGCAGKTAEITPEPQPTRDPNLEQSLAQQLAQMNPSAVPIFQEATRSMDSGDYQKSVELYQQVISMAPNFSAAYRRLGYIELNLKNIDQAEQLSRKALGLEPNSYNQSSLALVLVQKNTPKDFQEAFNLASAAVKSLPDDEETNLALLISAAATNDIDIARQTDQHLLQIAPSDPLAHYFAGLLAANDGKWETAEAELLNSQTLGMPSETVQQALNSGISRNAMISRTLRWGGVATAFWLLGLGILFIVGNALSHATINTLNNLEYATSVQIKPEEHRIRSIYRTVIAILSLYYYISMPFVLVFLFLVVGGAYYVFFLIGSIPIQLAVILVIMLLASMLAILRSLFTRTKDLPPGRALRKIDAPELWNLAEEAARRLETRPVDSIYVNPGVNIAVYERGSILQKMRGTSQRNLILGMGVLQGLTQAQFAAILAHEYGHFSNRDTAGGNLAHQVYASLHQLAQQLIRGRAAQIFNPVWLFVLSYQRIFRRATMGASRLQEVLADRYAAMAYGSQNFIDGLRSIVWQGVAFPLQAKYEIQKSLDLNRPVSNVYGLPVEEKLKGELNKRFEDAMQRPTSPDDSHPAPHQRMAWIERLHFPFFEIANSQSPALDLFPNAEALELEMTGQLMKSVRR